MLRLICWQFLTIPHHVYLVYSSLWLLQLLNSNVLMQILTFAYDKMHEEYVGMYNMPYYQKKMCTGHKSGKRTAKGPLTRSGQCKQTSLAHTSHGDDHIGKYFTYVRCKNSWKFKWKSVHHFSRCYLSPHLQRRHRKSHLSCHRSFCNIRDNDMVQCTNSRQ